MKEATQSATQHLPHSPASTPDIPTAEAQPYQPRDDDAAGSNSPAADYCSKNHSSLSRSYAATLSAGRNALCAAFITNCACRASFGSALIAARTPARSPDSTACLRLFNLHSPQVLVERLHLSLHRRNIALERRMLQRRPDLRNPIEPKPRARSRHLMP